VLGLFCLFGVGIFASAAFSPADWGGAATQPKNWRGHRRHRQSHGRRLRTNCLTDPGTHGYRDRDCNPLPNAKHSLCCYHRYQPERGHLCGQLRSPQLPDSPQLHVHMFFDTVPPSRRALRIRPLEVDLGALRRSPFTQYGVSNRPANATKMCSLWPTLTIRAAWNGNCVELPSN